MPIRFTKKRNYELMPGTLVKCESGRYIAYYEHRTDIIANGENERDAKKNLKKMYIEIIQMEEAEAESEPPLKLPPYTETKKFKEKLAVH